METVKDREYYILRGLSQMGNDQAWQIANDMIKGIRWDSSSNGYFYGNIAMRQLINTRFILQKAGGVHADYLVDTFDRLVCAHSLALLKGYRKNA